MSIILIYEFKGEIKGLNFPETLKVLRSLENITIIAMFILGIIAISFTTLYDFVVNSYFTLGLPFKKVLKISWISNSINNFIGLGRLVGASLRTFFYEKEGIEKKTAIKANIYILHFQILHDYPY